MDHADDKDVDYFQDVIEENFMDKRFIETPDDLYWLSEKHIDDLLMVEFSRRTLYCYERL